MEYGAAVIAGYGSIGSALLRLGRSFFDRFERLWIIDKEDRAPAPLPHPAAQFIQGDVEDLRFLTDILGRSRGRSFVFINLCSGTDNLRIRRVVAGAGGAYLDTACSSIYGSGETRFSRLMPHTFRTTDNQAPHMVCCGINPGMVEIVTRLILRTVFPDSKRVDVGFFEADSFTAELPGSAVAVDWSPQILIEETVLSPTLTHTRGMPLEGESAPTRSVNALWGEERLPARLVGHEEVWNLQFLDRPRVENGWFAYSLHPRVMKALDAGYDVAARRLRTVPEDTPVSGVDTVAIHIHDPDTDRRHTVQWSISHSDVFDRLGMNAVQFQVAASVLVFLEWLLAVEDQRPGMLFCASNLPIDRTGWKRLSERMAAYGVCWTVKPDLSPALDGDLVG